MHFLVSVDNFPPSVRGGGAMQSMYNLVKAFSGEYRFDVFTRHNDLGEKASMPGITLNTWNERSNYRVFYSTGGLRAVRNLYTMLRQRKYNAILTNTLFSSIFSIAPFILKRFTQNNDSVFIPAPMGVLEPVALNMGSRRLKRFYLNTLRLTKPKHLLMRATSPQELESIPAALWPDVPITYTPHIVYKEKTDLELNHRPKVPGKLRLVFISRIDPMKNLIFIIESLRNVEERVAFDIFGPTEFSDYWQHCQQQISTLPDNITVSYKGVIEEGQVIKTFSRYDLFFLPSHMENFGYVIFEALAAGVPVLISDRTPWTTIESFGAGWVYPLDDMTAFSNRISALAKMGETEMSMLRSNAQSCARDYIESSRSLEATRTMLESLARDSDR